MNPLLAHGKVFSAFALVGVLVVLGLRSRHTGPPEPRAPEAAKATPDAGDEKPRAEGLLVDLGNAICPINKAEVDGTTYVEWNGMRVGFCCPGCDTRFLKGPEDALADAAIEWKELGDAIARYRAAPAEHKHHELEAIRKKWKVLREPRQ